MASDRAAWAKRLGIVEVLEARGNKYHARGVDIDGIHFDSKKEATRYRELVLLACAGMVRDLECHPKFPINVVELHRTDKGEAKVILCGMYSADFRYVVVSSGEQVIEDVKSKATRTEAYRLRKRLVETIHGIRIREV